VVGRRVTGVRIAQGRFEEAVAAMRRAQELDPLSPRATIDVGWVLLRARRYEDAVAQARKTLELEPRLSEAVACLSEALRGLGRQREALELTRRLMQESGASAEELKRLDVPSAGAALQAAGEWRLRRALARTGGPTSWHGVAIEQALLGRKDDALQSLAKAMDAHEMQMVVVDSVPAFDPLKTDVRYQALLARVRAGSS
jgi:serine/threonine-protein kinase